MLLPDWLALALIVFALGMKHGLDPDHLATIDGLTRFNTAGKPRLARWSGVLFSLGHGLVVTAVAGFAAAMVSEWSPPTWLEHLGAWISIIFLLTLGSANLMAVIRTPGDRVVAPTALKTKLFGRLTASSHPLVITSIGAAFALSFDTWSQATLFSLAAMQLAGWSFAIALGLTFMAGMMLADGLNGRWVAGMLRNTDRRARIASRVMSLAIGLLSIAVAALGLARVILPEVAAATEQAGLLLGACVVALLLLSYALALRLSDRPA
jgi:nickel/cobalt transporter (NiCoT) family protein